MGGPPAQQKKKIKKQRLNWTAEQLELAKEAVQVRGLSKAEAAREFGVERTSLVKQISGKYTRVGAGRPPVLGKEVEDVMVKKVQGFHDVGLSVHVNMLRTSALAMAKELDLHHPFMDRWEENGCAGVRWCHDFLRRHKHKITARRGDNLDHHRRDVSEAQIASFF